MVIESTEMKESQFVNEIKKAWDHSEYKSLVVVMEGQEPGDGIDIFRGDDALILSDETKGKIIADGEICENLLNAASLIFQRWSNCGLIAASILVDK